MGKWNKHGTPPINQTIVLNSTFGISKGKFDGKTFWLYNWYAIAKPEEIKGWCYVK